MNGINSRLNQSPQQHKIKQTHSKLDEEMWHNYEMDEIEHKKACSDVYDIMEKAYDQ